MVCKAHLLGNDIREINTIVYTHTLYPMQKERRENKIIKENKMPNKFDIIYYDPVLGKIAKQILTETNESKKTKSRTEKKTETYGNKSRFSIGEKHIDINLFYDWSKSNSFETKDNVSASGKSETTYDTMNLFLQFYCSSIELYGKDILNNISRTNHYLLNEFDKIQIQMKNLFGIELSESEISRIKNEIDKKHCFEKERYIENFSDEVLIRKEFKIEKENDDSYLLKYDHPFSEFHTNKIEVRIICGNEHISNIGKTIFETFLGQKKFLKIWGKGVAELNKKTVPFMKIINPIVIYC